MFIYAVVTCHKIFILFNHFVNRYRDRYTGFLISSVDTHQIFGFVDVGKRKEIRINDF
jgi:hypothetical protein